MASRKYKQIAQITVYTVENGGMVSILKLLN